MSVHHSHHITNKLKDKQHVHLQNFNDKLKKVLKKGSTDSDSNYFHNPDDHQHKSFSSIFQESSDNYISNDHNLHVSSDSANSYRIPNKISKQMKYNYYYENVFESLNNASPDLLLKVIVTGIIITTILVRSNLQINIFYSLIFSLGISYFLLQQLRTKQIGIESSNDEDLNKLTGKMNKKFNLVFSLSHESVLYMNPSLVKVFISMCPFARFDSRNFKEALVSANQLVRVYESAKLGQQLPNQTIDIAEALQRNVLNHIQSIIHSLPSTVIADYRFQVDLNILQKILQKIINDIKLIYEAEYERNGPNIYNPPPSTRSGPWDNPLKSKGYNKHWNFYY